MILRIDRERWPYRTPFRIARSLDADLEVAVVSITDDAGRTGRGEAAGISYDGETAAGIEAEVESIRHRLERGIDRTRLADLLPAGGARNAVDCALWDLEAKASGVSVWNRAGLERPRAVPIFVTIGIGSNDEVQAAALHFRDWPRIKIKVDSTHHIEAIRTVRESCPESTLIVDANQSWTCALLNELAPELGALGVQLIEQPVARAEDASLCGYAGRIPLAADESCVDRRSLSRLAGLYQLVNVKLDKTGGLTEGLATAREAHRQGFLVMAGCMAGTSLAMAPAMVVAQGAKYADLDGPLLHGRDRDPAIHYAAGVASLPSPALWG